MKLKALIAATLWTCLSGAAFAHDTASHCVSESYKKTDYTICGFDPSASDIRLFLKDDNGDVFGDFDSVNDTLAKSGEQLLFAMNAGMYHKDRRPVGGYVESGQTVSGMNSNKGPGNFHMLPNGVFWLSQFEDAVATYQGAHVDTTRGYKTKAENVMDATQSGPMLVIDGALHPKFNKGSASQKLRNGVGVTKDGKAVFVKSEMPVNFYDFASLFKDKLKTPNALYLDGVISRLYSKELGRNDFGAKMGPIVGVVVPKITSKAQYIANEAVLVTHGDTKVMFDPLPLSGFGVYPEPSPADIAKMMSGQGEYEGVDAVFISHAHRDHFSAVAMITYLTANSNVQLVAPKQALDMMQADANWDETLMTRMTILDMEAGDAPEAISIGDITATAVRIPHAGWPAPARAKVQNMVYRVTLGEGATVMHMGDADPRRQHFIPHKAHWAEQRTDTAFPPYWFLTSMQGRNILSDDMNVAKSIGVHVPIKVPADLKASGQDHFSKPGETREIYMQKASKSMNNIEYAIYSAHNSAPKTFEAQTVDDVITAYKRHDWQVEMSEMKRRFDLNENYTLPQFTIGLDEAYMIIEPNYDGKATVSAHKFNNSDIHIYGEKFSPDKVIEAINRFLNADNEWLLENLK